MKEFKRALRAKVFLAKSSSQMAPVMDIPFVHASLVGALRAVA